MFKQSEINKMMMLGDEITIEAEYNDDGEVDRIDIYQEFEENIQIVLRVDNTTELEVVGHYLKEIADKLSKKETC